MTDRKKILIDLIELKGNLVDIQSKLSAFPWDVESPLVTLDSTQITDVLKRFVSNDLNATELENWANAIELRDDIDFENNSIEEIINELANPVLYGEITIDKVKQMMFEY